MVIVTAKYPGSGSDSGVIATCLIGQKGRGNIEVLYNVVWWCVYDPLITLLRDPWRAECAESC
jgi:hypothetical protein